MKATANALLLLQARASGRLLFFRVGVLLTLTHVLPVLYASSAWADTFTVTNLNDSGAGSLRDAIQR